MSAICDRSIRWELFSLNFPRTDFLQLCCISCIHTSGVCNCSGIVFYRSDNLNASGEKQRQQF